MSVWWTGEIYIMWQTTEAETGMQQVFVIGMNYSSAPVASREYFSAWLAGREKQDSCLFPRDLVSETVMLRTCNRVEVYGAGRHSPDIASLVNEWQLDAHHAHHLYLLQGHDAILHLFSVASGMNSMVLGETEINGQVKAAYEQARVAGHTGKTLNRLFQKAFETAKEIRTETAIGKGAASVGSVAVQHAQKLFGSTLHGRKVMVIGAGNMAEKCLKHLIKKGVGSITVVNRSLENAQQLAATYNGEAIPFSRCLEGMAEADIVITSTSSPHIILEKGDIEMVMAGRNQQPLAIIDIAVPRDVAPEAGDIAGVHLHNIGDLEETVRENIRYREQDLTLCRNIIRDRADDMMPMAV